MRLALLKITLERGVVPPTAPEKETLPTVPACSVRGPAPFTVLEKLIVAPPTFAPAFVLSKRRAPDRVTGPTILIMPPLVVRSPEIASVVPVKLIGPVVLTALL